jgi:hypothetical protein
MGVCFDDRCHAAPSCCRQLDLAVKPKLGRALLWPSVRNDDPLAVDGRTTHEARAVGPVPEGVDSAAVEKLAANTCASSASLAPAPPPRRFFVSPPRCDNSSTAPPPVPVLPILCAHGVRRRGPCAVARLAHRAARADARRRLRKSTTLAGLGSARARLGSSRRRRVAVVSPSNRRVRRWVHMYNFRTPNLWGCTGAFDELPAK